MTLAPVIHFFCSTVSFSTHSSPDEGLVVTLRIARIPATMTILNSETGQDPRRAADRAGTDGTAFYPAAMEAFSSNRDGH